MGKTARSRKRRVSDSEFDSGSEVRSCSENRRSRPKRVRHRRIRRHMRSRSGSVQSKTRESRDKKRRSRHSKRSKTSIPSAQSEGSQKEQTPSLRRWRGPSIDAGYDAKLNQVVRQDGKHVCSTSTLRVEKCAVREREGDVPPSPEAPALLPRQGALYAGGTTEQNSNLPSKLFIDVNDLSSLIQSLSRPNEFRYDKNIIPEFNPTQRNQRVECWIAKVNECAKIYNWTDEQTRHFALPKLAGHARKWYEGLSTILLTWTEWQERLMRAFPSDTNYGSLLTEMLERRMKLGESVDEYYYDKIVLLNACEIRGKKAVDCLVHGIDDKMVRAGATSARLNDPEDLLKFLKDLCREPQPSISRQQRSRIGNDIICYKCSKPGHRSTQCRGNGNEVTCYNCKEKGHFANKCPKPLNKCDACNRIGHKTADCFTSKSHHDNIGKITNGTNSKLKILLTNIDKPDAKYYKQALINDGIKIGCYVDLGSDCTLIAQDVVEKHSLDKIADSLPTIRGFGNGSYTPIGKTRIKLSIGEVTAEIDAYVVESALLAQSLLVGQDFTERPEVLIVKTSNALDVLKREPPQDLVCLPAEGSNDKIVLHITSDAVVNYFDFIECGNKDRDNCDFMVDSSYRNLNYVDYTVIGGLYNLRDGGCKIAVVNLGTRPLNLGVGTVLVRGAVVKTKELVCNRVMDPSSLTPITREEININPNLTREQIDSIVKLINKHRLCFAQSMAELGCTNVSEMTIELEDHTPVVYRPYRMSYSERNVVRNMVKDMIDNDIAEESNSSYASPIILVKKKTGGYRLCVDFRALNRKIKKDHYPMPRIDDQLDQLCGNKYYTSLDLASGYYQIPIREDCRHLTAFVTSDGLYQFKKMPFGLVNSPAIFQRTINKILGSSRHKSTLAYMDDILIPGESFEEGKERLEEALELLRGAGLTLNLQKCNFFQEELEYLGHEISEHGIKPGKAKITAVEKFPRPQNVHEVRQFVGLASYFRKFIKNFASIARPLTDLTKKHSLWAWNTEQEESFVRLKTALVQRPLLALYDPSNETVLHTDASRHGLGGILMQRDSASSSMKPVAYFSRKTTVDEQNYHAYELETLAAVASFQRFRVYLLGVRFTLVTDCNALRATFTKRDLLPRIARWWILMQEYDFDVQYRPGTAMAHVDALSRNPQPYETNDVAYDMSVMRITQEDWLLSQQLADTELQRIRKILANEEYSEIKQNYVMKDNKLFRKVGEDLKWVVPKGARFQLCKLNHDDIGHFSIEKTLSKICTDFWFPRMRRFITKYVRSCIECAYSKEPGGAKEGLLHPIHKVDKPFETVHIDHLGPFVKSSRGYAYLLVSIDSFTKFCILKPLRNLKSALTIRALDEVFTTFGFPNRLISDQGSSFTSKEFQRYCKETKLNHILNAVASPRANGQVERYNRTILDALTVYSDKIGEKYWDTVLGKLQWGLNNTLNKGIGRTPAEALFGVQMVNKQENIFVEIFKTTRQPGDIQKIRDEVSKHIHNDQQTQKDRYDKRRVKARVYEEGDLVKILKPTVGNDGKSKKLLPKYTGPFRVTKVLENDRYQISSIPGSKKSQKDYCNIWAADRIKPWITLASCSYSDSSEQSDD